MRTIGLIGGMSWESTIPYYRLINEYVREHRGGHHSAELILISVDFHAFEARLRAADWGGIASRLIDAARRLETAGADLLILCTNTMHRVAPEIALAVGIPLLHILDPTVEAMHAARLTKIGLLGTRFTMEQDFYRDRLAARHGLEVIVPESADRDVVHRIIFEELTQGRILEASRVAYRRVIETLVARGAQGIVLGCTELAMLIGPDDTAVPVFDTTSLHARGAAEYALAP
jgi:aspartate racemase